jgi:hypothetical protein
MPTRDPLAKPNVPGPVRTVSGTRPAIRLERVVPAPIANDADDSPTQRLGIAELRAMALRCASDVEPAAPPVLADLVADDDDEEADIEAAFFASEAAIAIAEHADSMIPAHFRREVLGEGYFARRFAALLFLAVTILALTSDVSWP